MTHDHLPTLRKRIQVRESSQGRTEEQAEDLPGGTSKNARSSKTEKGGEKQSLIQCVDNVNEFKTWSFRVYKRIGSNTKETKRSGKNGKDKNKKTREA